MDIFGLIAKWYDRASSFSDVERMSQYCDLPTGGSLLDLGGGTGRVASGLKGLANEIVVADISKGMLNQARKKAGLELVCSASERLPFPNDYFDRIIMIDAFHHVANQAMTLSEMWRSLKPGGRLVIQEPDIRDNHVKILAIFEKIVLLRSHIISSERIVNLFMQTSNVTQIDPKIDIKYADHNVWVIIDKII